MEYQYKCRITAWDFFRLTMRQTYRSMAGMCNLVFTVAMILLTAKFWSQSGEVLQVLMLIGCLLFPVIQPAAIYAKARRQAAAVPQDVQLTFDEKGLLVTTGGERQHLPWTRLRVTKQPGMVCWEPTGRRFGPLYRAKWNRIDKANMQSCIYGVCIYGFAFAAL